METIKAEIEGTRYLAIIETPQALTKEDADKMIALVQRYLRAWWQNGEKFGVLPCDAGVKIHLERIDP